MKTLLFISVLMILLGSVMSCNRDSWDRTKLTMTLQKKFPDAVIYPIEEGHFTWIVVDSAGAVHHIRMMGGVDEITHDVIIRD